MAKKLTVEAFKKWVKDTNDRLMERIGQEKMVEVTKYLPFWGNVRDERIVSVGERLDAIEKFLGIEYVGETYKASVESTPAHYKKVKGK